MNTITPALRASLVALLAALSAIGCRCSTVATTSLAPELVVTASGLSFEACPTKGEDGRPVQDVFPDTQRVTIDNRSNLGSSLRLRLSGANADAFRLVESAPSELGPGGSVTVAIAFAPEKKGDHRAQLLVDDEFEGTDSPVVTLVGTGLNLPSHPTLETAPQVSDGGNDYGRCSEEATTAQCSLSFPDTLEGQASELKLKLINRGCPALKVTALTLNSAGSDGEGFSIASPAQLPSEGAPLILSTADGTEEATVTLRFAPQRASGDVDPYRRAWLSITSNDPRNGEVLSQPALIALSGMATSPLFDVTPTVCDFASANDSCGQTPKVPNTARFRLANDGTATVRIDSTRFASSGSSRASADGRFSIATSVEGQLVPPNGVLSLEITHHEQPIFVRDLVTIEASVVVGGSAQGTAGTLKVALFGGVKPCLTTEPADQMNFDDPADELTARPVAIKNGVGCGTLTIDEVSVDSSPFFSTAAPLISAGASLAGGSKLEATVQYKRPPSGGIQLGTLRVKTNDPNYGPPEHKLVQLISRSPLDPIPVAELRACRPAELLQDPTCAAGALSTLAVQLSALTPKEITLSGVGSYDPDPQRPSARNPVASYKFSLLPGPNGTFPPGVTTSNLTHHAARVSDPTTVLSIPAGGTGTYRVALTVYDGRGQASANSAIIGVTVYP